MLCMERISDYTDDHISAVRARAEQLALKMESAAVEVMNRVDAQCRALMGNAPARGIVTALLLEMVGSIDIMLRHECDYISANNLVSGLRRLLQDIGFSFTVERRVENDGRVTIHTGNVTTPNEKCDSVFYVTTPYKPWSLVKDGPGAAFLQVLISDMTPAEESYLDERFAGFSPP